MGTLGLCQGWTTFSVKIFSLISNPNPDTTPSTQNKVPVVTPKREGMDTLQDQAVPCCGLLSTLHQTIMLALLQLLGWMKFRVLTIPLPPPNTTEVCGDSEDIRIRRTVAQTLMCIRSGSIKGVITMQRGYRVNFWRCSPGGATSWSIPPKFPKDPGCGFFLPEVLMFLLGGYSGQQH